ncbi:hypothetical protein MAR_029047, partial [Mya arenaria]
MERQTDVNTDNSDEKRKLVSGNLTYENNVPPKKSKCQKAYACLKMLLISVFGIILYSYDIVTDIQIALSYKERNDKKLFIYTILVLVCPACFIMIMDIGWLIIDYKRARKTETRTVKTNRATESDDATRNEDWSENQTSEETNIIWPENPDKYNLVLRIVVTVMTVGAGGSVCRTIQYTYYFVKSELACTIDRHDEFKKRARLLNLVTSALSITWSYSAYYRCNGANVNNKEDVKLIPFLIYILSVVSCIVP